MSTFVSPIFWYIITIGILVTVHEWGHFIVARMCGVHVERFSIGFGRALFKKIGKNGTEYQLAMIPLGGYVKMLDEREHEVPEAMQPFAFNRQSVQKRFAIVAAGPMANLILCIAFSWAVFSIGNRELKPMIATPNGLTAQAGLQAGDNFKSIDGELVQSWNDALPILALAAIDRRDIPVTVQNVDGKLQTHKLLLSSLDVNFDQEKLLDVIGIKPYAANPEPIVGSIQTDGPSANVLQLGDRILRINGVAIEKFEQISAVIAKQARAGENLRLDVQRGQQSLTTLISPLKNDTNWRIGIGSLTATTQIKYAPLPAFVKACKHTKRMTSDSFAMIGRLLTGKASVKNLSGPISIAKAADNQAAWGFSSFLAFLAAISLALCIMNLLPIPVLDGGHLFYLVLEWLTGKPVSESFQAVGQTIGLVLLFGLFGIAIFNDFFRIIS